MTQVHVIHHTDCQDGFGVVWAVHQRLEQEQGLRGVYHLAAYGGPPSETDPDSEVYILDFSYAASVMRQLYPPGRTGKRH